MRTETFHRLVTQPQLASPADTGDLVELVQRYPWFAVGHLLLAHNMEALGHVARKDALARAAIHAPDRKALHRLLSTPVLEIAREHEVPLPQTEAIAPLSAPPISQIAEEFLTSEVVAPEKEEPTHHSEDQPIEVQMPNVPFEPVLYDLERELEHLPLLEPKEAGVTDVVVVTEKTDYHEIQPQSALSFSDWLRSTSPRHHSETSGAKLLSPTEQTAVIERFLTKLPALEQSARAEFYSPEKAAKRSTDENALPVSETLARIYLNQGNTELAIRAFEHLALLHPEKKSYFAALAEKARQGQNHH